MRQLLELLAVMPAALAMCFVLTGVHGYLGLHVLRRKVIFVDLALAQIAALGGITAMALGFDPEHAEEGAHATLKLFDLLGLSISAPSDSTMVYLFSLGFALAGAAVFSFSRMRDDRVPQEAFIGVTFATAIAIALLLLVRVGGGAEQIRNMLARDGLLFSSWRDVAVTGALYGSIAIFHLIYGRRFFAISEDPEAARASGLKVRLWDFLFYASFAVVITESVQIAGVLLVFSYLVVPGAVGVLFATRLRSQIALAWGTGFGLSVLGLLACAVDNLEPPGSSPGPWIVAGLASTLAVVALARAFKQNDHKGVFARRVALGMAAATGLVLAVPLLSKVEPAHTASHADPILEALQGVPAAQLRALEAIEQRQDPGDTSPLIALLRRNPTPEVTSRAVEIAAKMDTPAIREALMETAKRNLDPGLKVEVATALAALHEPEAVAVALDALGADLSPFDAMEAAQVLEAMTGRSVDPEDADALLALRALWQGDASRLRSSDEASKVVVDPKLAAPRAREPLER